MYDEAFRVADVGEDGEYLAVSRVRNLAGFCGTSLDPEHYNAARAVGQVLGSKFRLGKGRVFHPRDLRVTFKPLRDGKRVFAVPRYAERQ